MKYLHIKTVARRSILLSFSLTMLMILIASIFFVIAQPVLPIFYSLALPEQQLAPKFWIFLLPLLSLGITLIHVIIMHVFREYETLILRMFGNSTIVIQALLFLALMRVVYLTL